MNRCGKPVLALTAVLFIIPHLQHTLSSFYTTFFSSYGGGGSGVAAHISNMPRWNLWLGWVKEWIVGGTGGEVSSSSAAAGTALCVKDFLRRAKEN